MSTTKDELVKILKPIAESTMEGYQVEFGKPFYHICEAFGIHPQDVITELYGEYDWGKIKSAIDGEDKCQSR